MKRMLGLVLLAGLWDGARIEEPAPRAEGSPELAEQARSRLADLATGQVDRVALTQAEVHSLVRYGYLQLLPTFVDSPSITLEQDRVRLRARIPVDKLPRVSGLSEVVAFLPDTTDFAVSGQLLPLDAGRVAFAIDEVSAANIPLPKRIVPAALNRLGRRDEPGLPAEAVALPLPPGAGSAHISGDSLIFSARPVRGTAN